MRFLKFFPLTILSLLTAMPVFAQNNLPDANDTVCWQSMTALHNCVQEQQDKAMSQAERCTSYPEYQCEPESEFLSPQQKAQEARLHKDQMKAGSTSQVQSKQPANDTSRGGGAEPTQ